MISAIVPTLNEEADLPGCLASLSWCDDVHVFDSYSTDGTLGVARAAGAQISQRRFDSYAAHRNAALSLPSLRHEWVLFLDADERVPEPLARQLSAAVREAPRDVDGFRLRRRDYFMGRWLKHAQISPYYVRLLRRGRVRYEREVNEVARVDGRVVDLSEPFDHFPFSKGLSHWIEKHNRYSTMEARCVLASRKGEVPFSTWRALFAKDFNERRFHQKELFYRLPARPLIKLFYMLFLRGAVLDGIAGIRYALLQTGYEWLIVLKSEEQRMASMHVSPPVVAPAVQVNTALSTSK